jgi:hypothetical protein
MHVRLTQEWKTALLLRKNSQSEDSVTDSGTIIDTPQVDNVDTPDAIEENVDSF